MKKLLIGLTLLVSMSSFAETIIKQTASGKWTQGRSEFKLELINGKCIKSVYASGG